MRVIDVERRDVDGCAVISAVVRSRFGERRLQHRVPVGLASHPDDASPQLAATFVPAAIAGEDLHVDGAVSPALLRGAAIISRIHHTWDPTLRVAAIDATTRREPPTTGTGGGVFLSRGVDSMYEAALADPPAPLTHAVFVDGIEPRHSPPVRAEEARIAGEAARLLGLEPVVVHTDVRDLTNSHRDWADVNAPALASLALALGGGLRDVVIPSSNSIDSMVPYGSHPAIDPLLSTAATRVHAGDVRSGRLGKVLALSRDRPDLLPLLKVCFDEDRPDNCGRCGKCLLTMCCLEVADALGAASAFPSSIEVERIRVMRPAPLQSRLHWAEVARALPVGGRRGELRSAILDALARSARPSARRRVELVLQRLRHERGSANPLWRDPTRGFDARFNNEVLALMTTGRPAGLTATPCIPDPPPLRPPA